MPDKSIFINVNDFYQQLTTNINVSSNTYKHDYGFG